MAEAGSTGKISKNKRLQIAISLERQRRLLAEARVSVYEELYFNMILQSFEEKRQNDKLRNEVSKLKIQIDKLEEDRIEDLIMWVQIYAKSHSS
jgi:sugar diacid utilization regulator